MDTERASLTPAIRIEALYELGTYSGSTRASGQL